MISSLKSNLIVSKSGIYNYKILNNVKEINIIIEKNMIADLLFFWNEKIEKVNITAKENSKLNLINIFQGNFSSKNIFTYDFYKESNCNINDINIAKSNFFSSIVINLIGDYAHMNYIMSSLSQLKHEKKCQVNINHLSKNTYSMINTFQIAKDDSLQEINCISFIKKGMSKSQAHQKLKLLVFDKTSKAKSNPTLLIDENDIIANHANSIGSLDPFHLFYLQSRGLSLLASKKLILMSYFNISINKIKDNKIKEEIIKKLLKEVE